MKKENRQNSSAPCCDQPFRLFSHLIQAVVLNCGQMFNYSHVSDKNSTVADADWPKMFYQQEYYPPKIYTLLANF